MRDCGNWWSCTQRSSSLMWYMINGSPNNSNKAYQNTTLPLYEYRLIRITDCYFSKIKMQEEFISWDLLECAYHDFLVHKRSTTSAYEYMLYATRDLPKLKRELEDGTYVISRSIAFCVTKPKLREVFTAAPRDRVVHHLLICQFGDMFESLSIEESFNCRKGKGNSAMTAYVGEALRNVEADGYVCKTDIQSCFMTIDKQILWDMLEPEVSRWCDTHSELRCHKEKWLWLWKMVVFHRPELNCEIHGDANLFEKLEEGKSLFKSNGKGLAIGNLTSQILANFYFHRVDRAVSEYIKAHDGYYARYMDDVFLAVKDKNVILNAVHLFRQGVKPLNQTVHPHKFYLQKANKSIVIIGQAHKNGRLYIAHRTVANALTAISKYNALTERHGRGWLEDNLPHIVSSINSYFGFMTRGQTFAIRYIIWNVISSHIKDYAYCKDMRKLVVNKEYIEYRRNDSQRTYRKIGLQF